MWPGKNQDQPNSMNTNLTISSSCKPRNILGTCTFGDSSIKMPCKSWDEACITRQRDNPPLREGKLWSLAENYKLARPPTSRRGKPPLPSYPPSLQPHCLPTCQVKVCSTSLSESTSTSLYICLPASFSTSTSNVQLLIIQKTHRGGDSGYDR